MKHTILLVWDGSQIQIEATTTSLIYFGARMNILFIIKVKIFVLIAWWPYRSSQFVRYCQIIELRMVIRFRARIPISFEHTFLEPHLTTYHSSIGVKIIVVLDLGTFVLLKRSWKLENNSIFLDKITMNTYLYFWTCLLEQIDEKWEV